MERSSKLRVFAEFYKSAFVIGAVLGMISETRTDEIARSKVVTAELCKDVAGLLFNEDLSPDYIGCIREGAPGGSPIGSDFLSEGADYSTIEVYVNSQQNEQGVEPGRIVLWGIGGVAVMYVLASY